MTVICVNNLTYGMTGGQLTPTTPEEAIASTSPYGNFEQPFNLPYLAESCGAVYVARWTTYHVTAAEEGDARGAAQEGLLASSRSSRPARRSTGAATGSATASTR